MAGLIPALVFSACGNPGQGSEKQHEGEQQQKPVVENVTQEQAMPMLNDSSILMIDVRTPGEVSGGYIDGADLFIDFNGDFASGISKLDKNKTYLLYCHSGGRSSRAAQMMEQAGFTHVYNLLGGISAWNGPVKR